MFGWTLSHHLSDRPSRTSESLSILSLVPDLPWDQHDIVTKVLPKSVTGIRSLWELMHLHDLVLLKDVDLV